MDTYDLSQQTYRAIMIEAEHFHHDLTIQFGVLSGDCKDEDDFIEKSEKLFKKMGKYNTYDMDWIFFGNPPPKKDFHKALNRIFENIPTTKEQIVWATRSFSHKFVPNKTVLFHLLQSQQKWHRYILPGRDHLINFSYFACKYNASTFDFCLSYPGLSE